ncbi:hypothetical protein CDAR_189011 [Caerostris darwini]|uniref:Uncharacterized protein n=1 Tax=Caerostris darwini TaxID=1538125 RepID=A0AAV4TAV5_9ARAC|nr:hypothetical protein CDAR_189011 [Caerostris darwini]
MVTPPVRKIIASSPISPSQNDDNLAETTNANLARRPASETVIDGNFVVSNYELLKHFMALKTNIDHMGLQITSCTRSNEVVIATQIATQKEEMQAICSNLNVLYRKLPPNQKVLDEMLTAHLEQLETAKKKAASAAAAKNKNPPQGPSQQKRKTPMTIDDEGFITPGSRRSKNGSTATPNPDMAAKAPSPRTQPLPPPRRAPDFSYAAATTNRPRPQAPPAENVNKPLDESAYEFLQILLRLARDNSLNADGIFEVVIDLIPELEALTNPHLKGAKILQAYSKRFGL